MISSRGTDNNHGNKNKPTYSENDLIKLLKLNKMIGVGLIVTVTDALPLSHPVEVICVA